MRCAVVDDAQHNLRLDVWLAKQSDVLSREFAKKMIKQGLVKLNRQDQPLSPDTTLKAGDFLEYDLLKPFTFKLTPIYRPLEVHFEDDDIMVVYKPAGLVTHPSAGHFDESLVHYLAASSKLSGGDPLRAGIVHRLDKDTTGLLVVAKNDHALVNLSRQFAGRSIKRLYLALVWGNPVINQDTINQPIGRHPTNRKKMAVNLKGKPAITHWYKLASGYLISLLKCELETGRTHQIRVHLSFAGMPILGDQTYGKTKPPLKNLDHAQISALQTHNYQCLHAYSITFRHPVTKQVLSFKRYCAAPFLNVLKAFKIDENVLNIAKNI